MSELMHYSSPYYDPVKAHQYYEEHKKLKGRHSTAGFNQTQKEAASYVKDRLNAEKASLAQQSRERTASDLEEKKNEAKSDIKRFTHEVQTKAARLRILLESGKFQDDPQARYEALTELKSMRDEIGKRRNEIMERLSTDVAGIRNKNAEYLTGLNDEYDKKYDDELAKIRGMGTAKSTGNKASSSSSNFGSSNDTEPKEKREFKKEKKAQTSKWAQQRERRRQKEERRKALGHSEIDEFGLEKMSEVMKANEALEAEFGDLHSLAHSLLEIE